MVIEVSSVCLPNFALQKMLFITRHCARAVKGICACAHVSNAVAAVVGIRAAAGANKAFCKARHVVQLLLERPLRFGRRSERKQAPFFFQRPEQRTRGILIETYTCHLPYPLWELSFLIY